MGTDWQLEAQVRGLDTDTARVLAGEIAALVKAAVEDDEDRYYLALIPRPEKIEEAA